MDIKTFIDLTCATAVIMIKRKTPEEIRKNATLLMNLSQSKRRRSDKKISGTRNLK